MLGMRFDTRLLTLLPVVAFFLLGGLPARSAGVLAGDELIIPGTTQPLTPVALFQDGEKIKETVSDKAGKFQLQLRTRGPITEFELLNYNQVGRYTKKQICVSVGENYRMVLYPHLSPGTSEQTEKIFVTAFVVDREKNPAEGLAVRFHCSMGTLGPVMEAGAGVYLAPYQPPKLSYPLMPVITAELPGFSDVPVAKVAVFLPAQMKLPIRTEPACNATLTIGENKYGPKVTDADGKYAFEVVVPPGQRQVLISAEDKAGNVSTKSIMLQYPPPKLLTVLGPKHPLAADGLTVSEIKVAAVDAAGHSVSQARIQGKARLGQLYPAGSQAGGVYTFLYLPPASASENQDVMRFAAKIGGLDTESEETIPLTSGPPAQLILDVNPKSLTADGASRATVRATLSDLAGNPAAGTSPSLQSDTGSVGKFVDRGNGKYEAFFTAPTVVGDGTARLNAQVFSTAVSGTPSSLYLSALPISGGNNGGSALVTARAVDRKGEPVGNLRLYFRTVEGSGEFLGSSITSTDGSTTVFFRNGQAQQTRIARIECSAQGTQPVRTSLEVNFAGPLSAPVPEPSLAALLRLGRADAADKRGALTADETIRLLPGEAAIVELVAQPDVLPADGESTASLTASLFDKFRNPLPGEKVQMSDPLGRVGSVSDRGDGTYTAVLTAPLNADVPETTVTATDMSAISHPSASAPIRFTHGPASRLTLTANPGTLPANGESTSALSAVLTDAKGNPVPNREILFRVASGSGDATPSGTTDSSGTAPSVYTAGLSPGTVIVEARVAETPEVRALAAISLYGKQPFRIELEAIPPELPADGQSRATLIAELYDDQNQPLGRTEIAFRLVSGDGALSPTLGRTDDAGTARITYTASLTPDTERVRAEVLQAPLVMAEVDIKETPFGALSASFTTNSPVCFGNAVQFTDTSTGTPVSWDWDLNGDGLTESTGRNPVYSFDREGPGLYAARLSITDAFGRTSSVSRQVEVVAPPDSTFSATEPVCLGSRIVFTAVTDPASGLRYHWEFGDGAVDDGGREVEHLYREAGVYAVSLTVTNGTGCSSTTQGSVTVLSLLQVSIKYALEACDGNRVRLSAVIAGGISPYTYRWNLGNGEESTEQAPVVEYGEGGTFSIALEVTDSMGCSGRATLDLQLGARLESRVLSVSQTTCEGRVSLWAEDASGGTPPYTYVWESNMSGRIGISPSPLLETWLPAGDHRITLKVTDETPASSGGPCTYTCPPEDLTVRPETSSDILGIAADLCTRDVTLEAVPATGGTPPYTYRWTSSIDAEIATGSSPSPQRVTLSPGDHSISLDVIDSTREASGGPCLFSAPPRIVSLPAALQSGIESVTLDTCRRTAELRALPATGGTPPYTYRWTSSIDGEIASGPSPAPVTVPLSPGVHSISLEVTDSTPEGSTGGPCRFSAEPQTVSLPAALESGIESVTLDTCRGTARIRAVPATGGTPPYTYAFSSSRDGVLGSSGSAELVTTLSPGSHTLTVEVTDSTPAGSGGACVFTATAGPYEMNTSIVSGIQGIRIVSCGGDTELKAISASGGVPPYTYAWRSDLSGELGTGATPTLNQRLDPGTHRITLEVHDSTPSNAGGPCAVSFAAAPLTVREPLRSAISATAVLSCDGAAALTAEPAQGGIPPYTYSWTSSIDGNLGTVAVPQHTCHLSPGLHQVTLTVRDSTPPENGGPCMWESPATPLTVNPLLASGIARLQVTSCSGETSLEAVSASGGEGPYTYSWTSSIDGDLGTSPSPVLSKVLSPGTHVFTLLVSDSTPASRGGPCTVTMTSTGPGLAVPEHLTASISGIHGLDCAGSTRFTADSASGGIPPYTYIWHDAQGGVLGSTTAPATIGFLSPGSHRITLEVQDSTPPEMGGPCSATAPEVEHVAVASLSSGIERVNVESCQGLTSFKAQDAANGTAPYVYAWTSSIDGLLGSTADSLFTTTLSPGDHGIILRVTDSTPVEEGGPCLSMRTISGIPVYPAITSGIQSIQQVSCDGDTHFTAVSPSGGLPPYTYQWSSNLDGVLGTSPATDFSARLSPGDHSITLTVTDSTPAENGGPCRITVVLQSFAVPPPISSDILEVKQTTCSGTVAFTAAAASGGIPPYTFRWTSQVDGLLSESGVPNCAVALSPGVHTITLEVIDSTPAANGGPCSFTKAVTQTVRAPLLSGINSARQISCAGDAELTAQTASGGTPPYLYGWSSSRDGDLGASAGEARTGHLSSGSHDITLTVTDSTPAENGGPCTFTATFANLNIPLSVEAAVNSVRVVACDGTTEFTADSASGGVGPYSYTWLSDTDGLLGTGNNPVASYPLSPGTHGIKLQLTDSTPPANGGPCLREIDWGAPVEVRPPLATSGIQRVQVVGCDGLTEIEAGAASGGTPPYTYIWTSSIDGALGSSPAPLYPVLLSPGNHNITLEVWDSTPPENGGPCIVTAASTNHRVYPPLTGRIASADLRSCTTTTADVLLTAAAASGGIPPYTYHWSSSTDGALSSTAALAVTVPLSPGNHSIFLQIEDSTPAANGGPCRFDAAPLAPFTVPRALTSSIQSIQTLECAAGTVNEASVRLTATAATGGTPPYVYAWQSSLQGNLGSSGLATRTVKLSPGTHDITLTVTDSTHPAHGGPCVFSEGPSNWVVPPKLVVVPNNDSPTLLGENTTFSLSVSGGVLPYTYFWNFGDGIGTSTMESPLYSYASEGDFTATSRVTDAAGCSYVRPTPITVSYLPAGTNGEIDGTKSVNVIDNDGNWLITAGDILRYTVTLTNISSEKCDDGGSGHGAEAIRDEIPVAKVTYVAGSAHKLNGGAGGNCINNFTQTGPDIVRYVAGVDDGHRIVKIQFDAEVNAGLPPGTEIKNRAIIEDPAIPVPVDSFIVTATAYANDPICSADAGADISGCETAGGFTIFDLDGSPSWTYNPPIQRYEWRILSDTTGGATIGNWNHMNATLKVPNSHLLDTVNMVTVELTIIDQSGCRSTDTIVVTLNTPPSVDVKPDNPYYCIGGPQLVLDAGAFDAGTTFLWSTNPPGESGSGATTQTVGVSPSQDTVYSVLVTPPTGCSNTGSEPVTRSPSPTAVPGGPYSACEDPTGAAIPIPLNGSGSLPPAPLTIAPNGYLWTTNIPGATFSDNTIATPVLTIPDPGGPLTGKVFLTVTNSNGCASPEAEAPVVIYGKPQADPGGPYDACGTSNPFLLDGSGSSALPPASIPANGYFWITDIPGGWFTDNTAEFPELSFADPPATETHNLTLYVTDSLGCQSTTESTTITIVSSSTAAPSVVSTHPADGDVNVPLTVTITVTFDSPIDPSTALLSVAWYAGAPGVPCTGGTTAVVSLMPPTSYDPVTFAASYAVTGLKKNKCHVAVVGGGVQNPCGVAMGAPKTWTFTAANKSLEITGWGP